jgi:hypothetical protein
VLYHLCQAEFSWVLLLDLGAPDQFPSWVESVYYQPVIWENHFYHLMPAVPQHQRYQVLMHPQYLL